MNEVKDEVLCKLNTLIGVLNKISVSGEQNCDNVSGSIKIVRDICNTISKCEITKTEEKKPTARQMKEG